MAGLVRGIPFRQILPRRACTQNPKNSVQDGAGLIEHRPALSSRPLGAVGKKGRESFPLLIGDVHSHFVREMDGKV